MDVSHFQLYFFSITAMIVTACNAIAVLWPQPRSQKHNGIAIQAGNRHSGDRPRQFAPPGRQPRAFYPERKASHGGLAAYQVHSTDAISPATLVAGPAIGPTCSTSQSILSPSQHGPRLFLPRRGFLPALLRGSRCEPAPRLRSNPQSILLLLARPIPQLGASTDSLLKISSLTPM
ncbi:hypothetical protein BC830DRAFT_516471 [Chytriomyces sp. MP71]|nr:hypothetical protein BC830DRAFT_516471 [Chytriomyces sp. MP71]